MRLRLQGEDGRPVYVTLEPGENLWLDNMDVVTEADPWAGTIGSLYLDLDGATLALGRVHPDRDDMWDYENHLPVPGPVG